MRKEVVSRAGAEDMITSGLELSEVDDVDFFWENLNSEVDNVLFPQHRLTDWKREDE